MENVARSPQGGRERTSRSALSLRKRRADGFTSEQICQGLLVGTMIKCSGWRRRTQDVSTSADASRLTYYLLQVTQIKANEARALKQPEKNMDAQTAVRRAASPFPLPRGMFGSCCVPRKATVAYGSSATSGSFRRSSASNGRSVSSRTVSMWLTPGEPTTEETV